MEKLQGSINPYLLQEELGMGCCLEEENGGLYISQFLSNTQDFEQGNEAHESLLPSLEDKMPFLQMLQGVESHHHHHQQQQIQNPFFPLMQEPNFQLLLKLQHQKSLLMNPFNELNNHHNQSTNISCLASGELESCVTNNNDIVMDLQSSPIAPQISTMDPHNVEKSTPKSTTPSSKGKKSQVVGPTKEKKKRKRTTTKPSKNKEEVKSQRITHIAVERNRRRQMNEHLNALRSLMPPSYVQREQAHMAAGCTVAEWGTALARLEKAADGGTVCLDKFGMECLAWFFGTGFVDLLQNLQQVWLMVVRWVCRWSTGGMRRGRVRGRIKSGGMIKAGFFEQ